MASEVKRSLLRVATNYARLLLTFIIGIVFVRLVLQSMGTDAFGLIGVLGSATGITSLVKAVVQRSMIRELGRAYHGNNTDEFLGAYNSAMVLTWMAMGVSSLLFVVMYVLLPWFTIPDELMWAARWFVIASACQTAAVIFFAAPMNMYLVKERMGVYNLWRVVERLCFLAGAAVVAYGFTDLETGRGIVIYGWVTAGLMALTQLSAVTLIILSDRRLIPRLHRANKADMRAVFAVGGWNTGVVTALNLHNHADNIIMNQAFGLFGNAVFTLSLRLTGYVRMLATGMTTGLDAVSARVSSTDEAGDRLPRLIYHTTRMHGLATLPAILCMGLLAEPALRLWIGTAVENPEAVIPAAVLVTWVLAVGITVHSIADGWITVLYGAGHISRYGPLIMIGGIANPVFAVALLLLLPHEPMELRLVAPALGYSIIMVVLHFILIPVVMAKTVGIRLRDAYLPLGPPLVSALIASSVPALALYLIEDWKLWKLAGVIGAYGLLFLGISYFVVLEKEERRRIGNAIKRRGKPAPGA